VGELFSPPGVAVLLHKAGLTGVPLGVTKELLLIGGAEWSNWRLKGILWVVGGGEPGRLRAGTRGEGVLEPGGERGWLDGESVEDGGETLVGVGPSPPGGPD